ncbi:MAG: S1/P1 nuclease [Chitinophagaceae bacterium]
MMNTVKKIIILGLFFYMPIKSYAWGALGHRIVGQIAESYLSPAAKKEITKILGTELLAMATNWADFIRSDSTYDYLSTWHYMSIKGGSTYEEAQTLFKNDSAVNAYTKINFLVKQLKNKQLVNTKKAFYLKLLIHFVGDIHQPLHVGRAEDEGGNRIKVLWFNAPTNLHSVWDSRLIDLQQLSYTEYTAAINHTTKAQRIMWQKQPISEWFWDSYQMAEKIYSDIKPDDKLGYGYNYKFIEIVNQRLLKGGVHLAGLLNEIFKEKKK